MPIPVSLESGDHLTRAEFHRRYCLRPDIKKAELVQGVVYVPSPTRFGFHSAQHGAILLWLGTYAVRHPDVRFGPEPTVYLDADTEVQPDAVLFREPPPPGGAQLRHDGYLEGAPQLVVEIAASSASYDLHEKRDAYQRAGVREYLVWRVLDEQFDWFRLVAGAYALVPPAAQGVIESEAFLGLRLDVGKLLAGDELGVLAALEGPLPEGGNA